MPVDIEQIRSLAKLSRLEFSPKEEIELQQSLNEIVEYMAKLKELDLNDVEPMMRVDDSLGRLRPDCTQKGLSRKQAFKNAPAVNLDHFSIPKTVK